MISPPTQAAWDTEWQHLYEQGRQRGLTPNAAIHRADRVMDIRGRGPRPAGEAK